MLTKDELTDLLQPTQDVLQMSWDTNRWPAQNKSQCHNKTTITVHNYHQLQWCNVCESGNIMTQVICDYLVYHFQLPVTVLLQTTVTVWSCPTYIRGENVVRLPWRLHVSWQTWPAWLSDSHLDGQCLIKFAHKDIDQSSAKATSGMPHF